MFKHTGLVLLMILGVHLWSAVHAKPYLGLGFGVGLGGRYGGYGGYGGYGDGGFGRYGGYGGYGTGGYGNGGYGVYPYY